MTWLYSYRATWIAGIFLVTAFVSTFWRGRLSYVFAAALYSIGSLIAIAVAIWAWSLAIWMNYGLSDTGGPNSIALAALPLPIGMAAYAIAAVVSLWPGLPQLNAIRWGKILHLVVLPLMLVFIFAGAFMREQGQIFPELKWLVYGPLWFRIRDRYCEASKRSSIPLNPARATWNRPTDVS